MGVLYLYLVIAIAIFLLIAIALRMSDEDKEMISNYSESRFWLAAIVCALIWPTILVYGIYDGFRKNFKKTES